MQQSGEVASAIADRGRAVLDGSRWLALLLLVELQRWAGHLSDRMQGPKTRSDEPYAVGMSNLPQYPSLVTESSYPDYQADRYSRTGFAARVKFQRMS